MGTFKECPRKYQLSMIFGKSSRTENVHLVFGLHYHAACERYDHAKTAGASHDDAMDNAVDYVLRATWDHERGRPWQSDDTNKNRLTLLRTVVWYLDRFENDPIRTVQLANGKPAVEVTFKFELGFSSLISKEPFHWCGHLDRIGIYHEQTYILDRKTTKHTISSDSYTKYTPDNQFSGYSLAGKVALGTPTSGLIVDLAQVAVNFSRFERGLITRTQDQLNEWLRDLQHWAAQAEVCATTNYWPQNDKACHAYGGSCPFLPICSKPPSVREEWLRAGYIDRKWNPVEARGDI